MMRVLLVLLVLLAPILPGIVPGATAAACTPGTDCYCDCVAGPDGGGGFKNAACQAKFGVGVPVDASRLWCEDWEAPTLINNQGVGGGAPYYGPWYDETGGGFTCNRGFNSYWNRNYGNGNDGLIWPSGQPSSPTLGCTCSAGGSPCVGDLAWDSGNRWQANSVPGGTAAIAIFDAASDFSAELGSLTAPTNAAGGGTGLFDGNGTLAQRNPAGLGNTVGITGIKTFTLSRTFGITQAFAYGSNLGASGILNAPWKHNEWGGTDSDPDSAIFVYSHGYGATRPFNHMFMLFVAPWGTDNEAGCNAKIAAATRTKGVFSCDSVSFDYEASSADYDQAQDWPDGTWACVRGHFENLGLTNSRIRIFLTPSAGPRSGVEQTLIDISNLNTSTFAPGVNGGYASIAFNNYANTNQGLGETPSTQLTFRYEDQFHLRAGAPVSCAQAGFGAAGGTPPAAPAGLTVR